MRRVDRCKKAENRWDAPLRFSSAQKFQLRTMQVFLKRLKNLSLFVDKKPLPGLQWFAKSRLRLYTLDRKTIIAVRLEAVMLLIMYSETLIS